MNVPCACAFPATGTLAAAKSSCASRSFGQQLIHHLALTSSSVEEGKPTADDGPCGPWRSAAASDSEAIAARGSRRGRTHQLLRPPSLGGRCHPRREHAEQRCRWCRGKRGRRRWPWPRTPPAADPAPADPASRCRPPSRQLLTEPAQLSRLGGNDPAQQVGYDGGVVGGAVHRGQPAASAASSVGYTSSSFRQ